MRKFLFLLGSAAILGHTSLLAQQRTCGFDEQKKKIIAEFPEFAEKMDLRKASFMEMSDNYYRQLAEGTAGKGTATPSPIPVIFHVIVSTTQLTQLGGVAGVAKRCDSQIAVLNRDYNRQNSDSTLIPSLWKPLYRSTGVRFGLAHTTPTGHWSPGYELKTSSVAFTMGSGADVYAAAKTTSLGGFDSWDVTRYLNVWCIYFSDNSTLLGIATPYSFTAAGGGPVTNAHRGVCVAYNAFGKRTATSDNYAGGGTYDRGRTLTHELGHFFELWHTWGDDGPGSSYSGYCPWSSGHDDGIADTPPEYQATYGDPTYTIANGTMYDGCKMNGATLMQPIGIPCLNFMDYTDDKAMHMFTANQAGVVAAGVLVSTGENWTLTQNPTLTGYPAGISGPADNARLNIFPNPTNGMVNITFDQEAEEMQDIVVTNVMGQEVKTIDKDNASIGSVAVDLSGMTAGIYFVTCNFATGSVTRKILLQ